MLEHAEGFPWRMQEIGLMSLRLPAYDEITPLNRWSEVSSTYVLGTKDRIISQDWARDAVPRRLGVAPLEVPTGHCPQNSQPALL
jgi:hypothetical protein